MFELICGNSSFASKSQDEVFNNIKKQKINWPNDIPHLIRNLISKILNPNPKDRISLKDIISNVWFDQNLPIYKPIQLVNTDIVKMLERHLLSIKPENIQKEIKQVVEKNNNFRVNLNTILSNYSDSGLSLKASTEEITTRKMKNTESNHSSSETYLLEQKINVLTKECH